MSNATRRTFEDHEAVREAVPLIVGMSGPSGSGKTFSALRLAAGIQKVTGGDTYVIDTEAKRALHYADQFNFRHVPFGSPFSPLDYLAAIQHCVRRGARTIIIDSMSHEHEGPGGVLEMHAEDAKKMADFSAWARPKAQRRRLINSMMQLQINMILLFRAKEKSKPEKGKKTLIDLGWQPIGGDEYIYECTTHTFLRPASDGVPTWSAEKRAEQLMIKLPRQFRGLLDSGMPFDERMGEEMAKWAAGDQPAKSRPGPRFGKLDWRGASDWTGKPLAEADEPDLRDYRAALGVAMANATDQRVVAKMKRNLEAVDALLPPDSSEWGDPPAPENEVEQ